MKKKFGKIIQDIYSYTYNREDDLTENLGFSGEMVYSRVYDRAC